MTMTEATMDTPTEELHFKADVNQVLDIVVNSLYSHREIFLRELISNASDALDRLKFRALTDHELTPEGHTFQIRLLPDRENKALIIEDTGEGMTKEQLVKNLGTIAHSGAQEFIRLAKEEGQSESIDLIGRFGVGFYSAFLVADRVEVTSRAAGQDEAWRWTSEAKSTYRLEPLTDEEVPAGTRIRLHLKEDQAEYLDEWRLKELVTRYSDFVNHPIKLQVTREEEVEAKEEGEEKKSIETTSFETINQGKALWKRPKSELTDEQYEDFYKHLTRDWQKPLSWTHFTIEGTQLFTGLLYLPTQPPFDLHDRNKRRGVRLYVKRVFIMDDCEELLPEWLRFVRGIIDSDDLPLNVSRELLQEEHITRTIRKQVIKKTLALLEELATDRPDDYKSWWNGFGGVLKEGLHFEWEYKDDIAKLCRFASSKSAFTSLADYVSRMPEEQKAIYYVLGDTRTAAEGSPYTEALTKRGYEVLYLTDAIDEWATMGLREFDGKPLQSAMKADLDLESSEEEKQELQEQKDRLKGLCSRVKGILSEHVSEVRLSKRLTDSPCCLVIPEGGMHAHVERMFRQQAQNLPAFKRIFELNPTHPLVQHLEELHGGDPNGPTLEQAVHVLYDQALIAEGSPVRNPLDFSKNLASLLQTSLAHGWTGVAKPEKAATEPEEAPAVEGEVLDAEPTDGADPKPVEARVVEDGDVATDDQVAAEEE